MIDLRAVLAVAAGSAVGGSLRFLAGLLFVQRFGAAFPYGTLFINVTGSYLIGVVVELAALKAYGVTPFWRIALATGLCGGYTTFSSYALEIYNLGSDGRRDLAAVYAAGSVALGVLAFYLGLVTARMLTRSAA